MDSCFLGEERSNSRNSDALSALTPVETACTPSLAPHKFPYPASRGLQYCGLATDVYTVLQKPLVSTLSGSLERPGDCDLPGAEEDPVGRGG